MQYKKRYNIGLKKSLISIVASAFLFAGVPLSAGCHQYSKLENEVYEYVDKFSKKIPQEFVKTENGYHDSALSLKDGGKTMESGKGRFVIMTKEPETITAGYMDVEELVSYIMSGNLEELKTNLSFTRITQKEETKKEILDENYEQLLEEFTKNTNIEPKEIPKLSEENKEKISHDVLVLIKKDDMVIYVIKDGKWKKGVYKVKDVDEKGYYDKVAGNGQTIENEQVQRYIDLSKRLKKTYFKDFEKQ
jgi:hypothetical protein